MLALEGIKVLDVTRTLPGPFCNMWLADMGADVIRVEETQLRDDMVSRFPFLSKLDPEKREALLTVYQFANRNKRSICLNLRSEEGRRVFYKLAEKADVVVVESRPGVSKRLGIDYETLSQINPRIIQCEISAYGQTGPYHNVPAHNPNCLGVSGVLGITGTAAGEYVLPGVPIADLGGGEWAAFGILCALIARGKTGRGQLIDASMTDGLVYWLAVRHGQFYFAAGMQPKLGDRPTHVYETKDGKHFVVSPPEPHLWERLCRALGLEEYIPYRAEGMEFASESGGKTQEIVSRMAEVFRTKTRDEWFQILGFQADTCASPMYETFDEVFSDPQLLHREMIVEAEHPTLGKVKQVGIPVKLSDTPGKIRMLPPQRGQHTEEILTELGYTKNQIQALHKGAAIA